MPDYCEHMKDDIAWLKSLGLTCKAPSPHQLKIECRRNRGVSYYPAKGTIFVDGEKGAREKTGRDALEAVLIDLKVLEPNPTLAVSPPTLCRRR